MKAWGIAVNLSEMAKLSEDTITQSELKSDKLRIRTFPLSMEFYEAVRLDIPLIVRLNNPEPNEAEYVILLKVQGEAVTVGDPNWGLKMYRTKEFLSKYGGAYALYADVNQLSAVKKGDRNETVKNLQEFLKRFLDSKNEKAETTTIDVNGLFDVKTTDAIRRFQSYFNLRDTGQLDDMTMMLLNSRMMRNGPRLQSQGDRF